MSIPPDRREFLYQPRPKWTMIYFFALALGLIWLSNSVLSGFLSQLALFMGIGAIVGGTLGIGLNVWYRLLSSKRIVVTETHICLPNSIWFPVEIAIPYERVTTIERRQENRPPLGVIEHCVIMHADGKTTIDKRWLSTPQDFEEIVALLQSKGISVQTKTSA